ncbi:hypothetical protein JCM10207_004601 [Rhodosporidiobolus poonsookiae]
MLIDSTAEALGSALGASADQIKVILLLVGAVPLSLAFPYFAPSTRSSLIHFYALLPSALFFCILDLPKGYAEIVADCLATWVIAKVGVSQKWGRTMPWLVFTVVMGHLAVNHIGTFLAKVPGTAFEVTTAQMVLCMKLISFAWSVYDGQRPEAELDATQKASRIDQVPGLLPFLSYALFFPSILAGPAVTYRSYESWTSHRLFAKEQPSASSSAKPDPTVIPPGRRRKALKRFITGVVYLGIFSVYAGSYGMNKLIDPDFLAKTTFWQRFFQMNLAGFLARTKYYAVWCIAESAYIISGLGYNPQTKHYDASRNVRIRSIELAPNFKVLLDSWNINTNVWLRECIYKRVAKKGRKPGFKSTQITFITSALWHGVNPCYLMTFVLGGFAQSLNRALRAGLRPFFLPPGALSNPSPSAAPAATAGVDAVAKNAVAPAKAKVPPPPQTALKTLYDIGGTVCTLFVLNFAVVPFLLLDVRSSLAAWRAVHFYGLHLVFVPFVLLNWLGGLATLKRMQKKRDAAAAKPSAGEKKAEEERVRWEKQEEEKRRRRGEGVPSMGMDVEHMVEQEEREARQGAKKEL